MKPLKCTIVLCVCLSLFFHAIAQRGPEDGTYFVVNAATGQALTPVDGGVNSNTRLRQFSKSGMQKWKLKKYTAKGKNGKETTSFTLRNVSSGFYLRPYFVPDNHEAIVSDKDANSNLSIVADEGLFIIKSIQMGGDALYSKRPGAGDDEPWFAADEKSDNYRWKLIATE